MSRVHQLIWEQVDFDLRLRSPVHWLLWLSTAFLVVVVVFDWRPLETLHELNNGTMNCEWATPISRVGGQVLEST